MPTIRPRTDHDIDAVAALISQGDNRPLPPRRLRELEAAMDPEKPAVRLVAEDGDGIAGVAVFEQSFSVPAGWMSVLVKVDERARRAGLGTALWERMLDEIAPYRPGGVQARVPDFDPDTRAWCERRGFSLWAHRYNSAVGVAAVDLDQLPAARARAADRGYRVVCLADVPGWEHRLRDVYEIDVRVTMDAPDMEGAATPTWDGFMRMYENFGVRAEDVFLALRTDADDWVGLTYAHPDGDDGLYTGMTGVLATHRGHGLARLLKLEAIAAAKARGVTIMRTSNLSINEPMLAVNRRLGYVPERGTWLMRKPLFS